ncbi:hypothetical protein FisN_3Lh110 [Fistulifera solaris]|uniref:GOLD domain-containing protein n=1 Tax=Fistulifera solaris TaxID=1519565 RepID=A0A1Z5KTQ8_FISSO|nr:hypothetical protein FisN_3Lh110 [Fistulifera solaris]|eukprot:GAX29617.1 hypothetical protein FisN_3Lh110 [Fistulifera solaris]
MTLPFLLFSLAWIAPTALSTYMLELTPGTRECFYTKLPGRATIVSGNYDIIDDDIPGDYLSVTLQNTLAEDGKRLWHNEPGSTEGIFSLTVDRGLRLAFCFEFREISDDETETIVEQLLIGWNIRVHAIPRELPDGESGPDTERARRLLEKAVNIEMDWSNLMDHFAFLRSREAVHMKLTSDILNRIMGWTLVEAFVVMAMAFLQVMYWKKFFEQRRYL